MRLLALACLVALPIAADAATPSIDEKVKGLTELSGYHTLYWDEQQGKLWLKIGRWNEEFLYTSSLPAGIGSNDIGLDRGQLGRSHVVRWERTGSRVLLMETNYGYRAISENAYERRAVRDSFAEAALWGFDVAAATGNEVLVDATAFFLRDAHEVAERLQAAKQGTWKVDISRCAFYLPRTKSYPKNTEVEATITLTGGLAGEWLRSVSADATAITVREHHSFVELPGPGYVPRAADPRSGFFGIEYSDYSTPVDQPIVKRFICRHRLQRKDPDAAISEPVQPIVYYLDRGTPEPIRSALLEGAGWWSQAFEAAGYKNAFRVEMMPEDADPMDARYNIIQWVHRSTRGWSYGASITDPRTGEIIKGHVTLGSLRVRQDYLIATSYMAPYETGKPENPQMMEMAMARLRQLAAHEVGHTLGLQHNYIASTRDRASVMDYPHPQIDLKDGVPGFSNAYASGIGEWDKVAIAWGYGEYGTGAAERQALNGVLDAARRRGLVFLTDQDARPPGSADPDTHLWDSGADATEELNRLMAVRARALARFGENNVREGAPLALLNDALVPLYFGHRYQLEAAVKAIGGQKYRYALRGDGQTPTEFVDPQRQRNALEAVLATLKPGALTLPERIIALIPPRPSGYEHTRELFEGRTGMVFDPVGAAESAANLALELILNPQRASRLVIQHARQASQPSLEEVLDRTIDQAWKTKREPGLSGEVQCAVAAVTLRSLMHLVSNTQASEQARAIAFDRLRSLRHWLELAPGTVPSHMEFQYAAAQIAAFEKNPKEITIPAAPDAPPGMPIGLLEEDCDW
jgi:hypothetical protein